MPEEIKVFKVNDYEWWAGVDLESIRNAYKEHTGIDPDSDEGFDNPHAVGEAGMSKLIIFEDGPEEVRQTFAEYLDHLIAIDHEFPCYFAGTEI
jgi:hypothetical protein